MNSASLELPPHRLLHPCPALLAGDAPTSMLMAYNFRQYVIFAFVSRAYHFFFFFFCVGFLREPLNTEARMSF